MGNVTSISMSNANSETGRRSDDDDDDGDDRAVSNNSLDSQQQQRQQIIIPRRLSQRPGCTIILRDVGCKILCKTPSKRELKRMSTTVGFPFTEPDEEIGAPPPQNSQYQQQQRQQQKKYFEKTILQNVTGVITPGMWAILGPSGAGKSTLLDIITKRKTEGVIMGEVLLDGKISTSSAIKKYTSYVAQADIFYGGSTVFEIILFTAMIKIPDVENMCREDVYEQVEGVIRAMNLEKCRNTYLGNNLVRGVSGGEKKRVSVACSLLTQPRCMFLDEPTSGLDSAMAREVMISLKELQMREGRTIVTTIHQPSTDIYNTFDGLILLNKDCVYFGRAGYAPVHFFEKLQGVPKQLSGCSVSEYLLEALSFDGTITTSTASSSKEKINFAQHYASSDLKIENQELAGESGWGNGTSLTVQGAMTTTTTTDETSEERQYERSLIGELLCLVRYKFFVHWLHSIFWFSRVLVYQLLAATLSVFFYGQDRTMSGILNVNGILFIMIILPMFMAQGFIDNLKMEREVYTKEFHDSYYRAFSYVTAKVLIELPGCAICAILYTCIIYFSIGLDGSYWFVVLANLINMICCMLIGYTIAATIPGEIGPGVLLPVFGTLNMLVSGFFIRCDTIPKVWKWLYEISWMQWSWSAVMVNEFGGSVEFTDHCTPEGIEDMFTQLNVPPAQERAFRFYLRSQTEDGSECEPITGESILRTFSLQNRKKYRNLAYASIWIPICFTLFYLGVLCVKHEKR